MSIVLPSSEHGFGVEVDTGQIHRRYPTHQTGPLHRTTPAGVLSMAIRHDMRMCTLCYPPPEPLKREPRARQKSKPEPKASGTPSESDAAVAAAMDAYRAEFSSEDTDGS